MDASLTGVPGADATIIFEFFIPENDANGNPVLPPDCTPATSINDVKAEGDWTPLDACDNSPVHVMSDVTPDDHTLMDKCLAIQKSVAIATDHGAAGPTPFDILQYTLDFQVSDFRTLGNLTIHDVLSDGQTFDTSFVPTLSVTDQFGNTVTGNVAAAALSILPNQCGAGAPPPRTVLDIDVSLALSLLPASAIMTGGHGQIVFQALIDDAYACPVGPGDAFVDKDDPLTNAVTIHGDVLLPLPTGDTAEDDSAAAVAIVTDIIKKTVYAVKRGATEICGPTSIPCPAQPQVKPGDKSPSESNIRSLRVTPKT